MTMKALGIMALFTIAMISIFNFIGFQNHHDQILWAIAGALFLVVTLVGNVWLFIGIAQEEPWSWFKEDSDSE